MTGLEYIQRHIDIVKQQIKGSKIKIFVTTDNFKKTLYEIHEQELQTLESIGKSLKALEIIKEKDVDIVSLKNALSSEQYNSFISFRINYMDYMKLTEEEFNLLKEVLEWKNMII